MKTKNIEEAIKRIKDFKDLLVKIDFDVTLKDGDKEITLKKSDLILALEHIEEQGKEKQQVLDDYQDLGKDLANNFISKQVIRDKILERQFELQQEYEDFEDDIRLNTLQEIYYLNEEEK